MSPSRGKSDLQIVKKIYIFFEGVPQVQNKKDMFMILEPENMFMILETF